MPLSCQGPGRTTLRSCLPVAADEVHLVLERAVRADRFAVDLHFVLGNEGPAVLFAGGGQEGVEGRGWAWATGNEAGASGYCGPRLEPWTKRIRQKRSPFRADAVYSAQWGAAILANEPCCDPALRLRYWTLANKKGPGFLPGPSHQDRLVIGNRLAEWPPVPKPGTSGRRPGGRRERQEGVGYANVVQVRHPPIVKLAGLILHPVGVVHEVRIAIALRHRAHLLSLSDLPIAVSLGIEKLLLAAQIRLPIASRIPVLVALFVCSVGTAIIVLVTDVAIY